MASLEKLLRDDGFKRVRQRSRNSFKFEVCRDMNPVRQIRSMPESFEARKQERQRSRASQRSETEVTAEAGGARSSGGSTRSEKKKNKAMPESLSKEVALDEAAVLAVISMLGAFCSRFVRNEDLRASLRKTCADCLRAADPPPEECHYAEQAVVSNLDWGIDGVEAAVAARRGGDAAAGEAAAASLRNATRMLGVAASLDVEQLRDGTTCGVRNSCLAACAHFYLAMAHKLLKNDRLAAVHLLQVFIVSPAQGRESFCREVWDSLFLPHLLHIKVWYNEQYDIIDAGYDTTSRNPERSKMLKRLRKAYLEELNEGTRQFATYYKEWLMIGVKARDLPSVELSTPSYEIKRRMKVSVLSVLASPVKDSPSKHVGLTLLRRSLSEAVFDTPKRTGMLDKTTRSKLNAERSKTFTSMNDIRQIDMVVNVKGNSYSDQSTQASEAEELQIRPIDHELEYGASHMKEGTTQMIGNQAEGADERILATGVLLEGRELEREELLQLWGHMSNIYTFTEKCSIIPKLSDREGNGLTVKKLAEIVSCLRQSKTFTNSYSPLSPLSSSEMNQPTSESEVETEPCRSAKLEEHTNENDAVSTNNNPMSHNAGPKTQNTIYFRQSSTVRIPKDFVCPLADKLFEDPITIETGQTYERAGFQEWLDHGNTTCPITWQKLENLTLPCTNYILKEAVDAWKITHLGTSTELGHANAQLKETLSFQYWSENLEDLGILAEESPKQSSSKVNVNGNKQSSIQTHMLTRRFLQVEKESVDSDPILHDLLNKFKQATAILCTSDSLIECEEATLTIAHVWKESNTDPIVEASLSKVAIIDALMEVLSTSHNEEVVGKIVHILADLTVKSDLNRKIILRADSDLEIIMRIIKTSILPHAIILLHLLKPPVSKLVLLDLIPWLLAVIANTSNLESLSPDHCTPQEAAILLLEQLVTLPDHNRNRENAKQVISLEGIPFLLCRLEFGSVQEKISATSVLCCCMQADGNIRHILMSGTKKASIVGLLHCNQGMSRTVGIAFLVELLCLNRRTAISKFLTELQKEGLLNTMHILLVYLQTASLEQQPMAAALLLQLDLLVQPRRYSVYREEAVEAIIAALHSEIDKKAQVQAAKALLILGGHFSYLGQTLLEAWLLKRAGLEGDLTDSLKEEHDPLEDAMNKWSEEKNEADDWEKKIASVLLTKGKSLFEALAKSLSCQIPELVKPCLVTATWLSCALTSMPDTGMQIVACSILLPKLVRCLRHDRQVEERILAALSLHSYMQNPECLQLLLNFGQEIIGPLRRLKWVTWTAKELLDVVVNDPLLRSHADIFIHGEVAQMDASVNGRTQAFAYSQRKLYSGHADGTIKVWDVMKQQPMLITEVKKHKSSVTCLGISQSSDRLFSASADKSIRVWKLDSKNLVCMQIVQTKDVVQRISVDDLSTFFITEGYGIKVLDNYGMEKTLNGNRPVQGLAIAENKVYCGCSDWSLQEVDLQSGEVIILQAAHSTLVGTQSTVCELEVFKDCLYVAGNSIEGVSTQVWSLKRKSLTATIFTTRDVVAMVVNEDYVYLGCNASTGLIEVWLREKLQKVAVICLESRLSALSFGEDVLYSASEDGKIQAWASV